VGDGLGRQPVGQWLHPNRLALRVLWRLVKRDVERCLGITVEDGNLGFVCAYVCECVCVCVCVCILGVTFDDEEGSSLH
jgi:hypothetical protein